MNRWILALLGPALLLAAACTGGEGEKGPAKGSMGEVRGTVVAPLEGAQVYVYRKGMDLYGPAFAVSEATGADGTFLLSLPDGDYVLVVRRRESGEGSGPVVAGDHKSEFIPLVVRGGSAELTIRAPVKIGDARQVAKEAAVSRTGLAGRVTDAEGNPVEGSRVHVYDHVQMSERPKFVSEKTGPDGRYLVHLPEGGTYYLAARDKFGGPPKLGDLYGRYDQGTIEPSAVVVKEGEILREVDITVTKVW